MKYQIKDNSVNGIDDNITLPNQHIIDTHKELYQKYSEILNLHIFPKYSLTQVQKTQLCKYYDQLIMVLWVNHFGIHTNNIRLFYKLQPIFEWYQLPFSMVMINSENNKDIMELIYDHDKNTTYKYLLINTKDYNCDLSEQILKTHYKQLDLTNYKIDDIIRVYNRYKRYRLKKVYKEIKTIFDNISNDNNS